MKHEFQAPIVVEVQKAREPLTPDDFGIFPGDVIEIGTKVDTLTTLGRRVLNETKKRVNEI